MSKILPIFAIIMALLGASCHKSEPEFVVKGTTSQARLNGVQVFLVPYGTKQYEDSIGVDSVVIEDGKFEFKGKGEYLARVTIDRHHRYGTQDLLIVTEPGCEVDVVIDSISSGHGTPQNETLQRWKEMKHVHDAIIGPQIQRVYHLRQSGDSLAALALSDSIKIANQQFASEVVGLANILGKGTAYDLLTRLYGKK